MKDLKLTFLCVIALPLLSFSQVIYVNQTATGAANGSSWEDAYTNLSDALLDESSSEIWITGGLYAPTNAVTDSFATYMITRSISIYGGFAGTETIREEVDLTVGNTILTADRMMNDNGIQDSIARIDNDRHVLFVMDGLEEIKLDRINFMGGETGNDPDSHLSTRAGGGIYSLSALNISNCTFSSNFGRSGASLCINNLDDFSEEVIVQKSIFENNRATAQSAGPVFFSCRDILVEDCQFLNNVTVRGACYPVEGRVFRMENCLFEGNTNVAGFGAAFFSWQVPILDVKDCLFKNNMANNAGACYLDGRLLTVLPSLTSFEGCVFEENVASGFGSSFYTWQIPNVILKDCRFLDNTAGNAGACYFDGRDMADTLRSISLEGCEFRGNQANATDGAFGGCVYSWNSSFSMANCDLIQNESLGSAGALFIGGSGNHADIQDCDFQNNVSEFGGAIASYGTISTEIINSSFELNSAIGGAAINNGFESSLIVNGCEFMDNSADFAGAIGMQNDLSSLMVLSSRFDNNASTSGGAIGIFNSTNGPITIRDSHFEGNSATSGGALFLQGHGGSPRIPYLVEACVFNNNRANMQAGAINVANVEGTILNSLFTFNTAFGTGTGGAISLNADSINTELVLQHCTLVDNVGELSGGLAAWGIGGEASFKIRNTILSNIGEDFVVEDGRGRFISEGGTFTSKTNLLDSIDLSLDVFDFAPGLVDRTRGEFYLQTGSPCIDRGLSMWGLPEDLEGRSRTGLPDLGCFEYDAAVFTKDLEDTDLVKVFPNPAVNYIQIENTELVNREMSIYNEAGKLIKQIDLSTNNYIDVKMLSPGFYTILLKEGSRLRQGSFVKVKD